MSDVPVVAQVVDVPAEASDVAQEIEQVISEYSAGNYMRERALFRVWRIWRSGRYLDITYPGSYEPMYPRWGDFVADVLDSIGISRSTLYSRLRVYSELEWLGYTQEEMLGMMVARPSVIDRAINKLVSWSAKEQDVVRLKMDGDYESPVDARDDVRMLVDEVFAHENPTQALGALERYVGDQLLVRAVLRGSELVLVVTDKGGDFVTPDVEYALCDLSHIPQEVLDVFVERYRIKRED